MKLKPEMLQPYIDAGMQLIPLHAWNYVDSNGRKRGKSPRDRAWPTKDYNNKHMVQLMKEGGNIGVRLTDTILVVDVDPRNFNEDEDSFAQLCKDFKIDIDEYPVVQTGAGGLHIYMRIAPGQNFIDSHPSYPGVEFKSRGRQVVAAGSVHPDTQKAYVWSADTELLGPALKDRPDAPESLLALIRRAQQTSLDQSASAGIYSQEQLAEMLEALDPVDFNTNDTWAPLMMACHHATDGAGRQEFIDWCEQDPAYTGDRSIGTRWDSCRSTGDGPKTTYRTLNSLLIKAGAAHLIPAADVSEDFDVIAEADIPDYVKNEQLDEFDLINEKYCFVMNDGGGNAIVYQEPASHNGVNFLQWKSMRPSDFKGMFSNKKIETLEGKTKPLGIAWLESPRRRTVEAITFHPERDDPRFLNQWTGWAVQGRKEGSWDYLQELLFEVLCDGNVEVYNYVMNWAAAYVQRPATPGQVAIVFQGEKGIGKSTWGRVLVSLAGNHGIHITSSEHITGRFNGHLRNIIMLFADEAISPRDNDAESRLKGMITEPRLMYERKGKEVEFLPNMLHIMMASNEDHVVAAGTDGERRYMVQRANEKWQGKTDRFKALHRELEQGGLQKLMFDLLARDITNYEPYRIPNTNALYEQKVLKLPPTGKWWLQALEDGYISGCEFLLNTDWAKESVIVVKEDLVQSSARFAGLGASRRASNSSAFSRDFLRYVPRANLNLRLNNNERFAHLGLEGASIRTVELPSLPECREFMGELLGRTSGWEIQADIEDDSDPFDWL